MCSPSAPGVGWLAPPGSKLCLGKDFKVFKKKKKVICMHMCIFIYKKIYKAGGHGPHLLVPRAPLTLWGCPGLGGSSQSFGKRSHDSFLAENTLT